MNENDRILPTSIPDYASSSNLMNREKEDGEEGDEETRSTRKRYYFSLLPPA